MLRQRQLIKTNPIAFPAIRREMIPATVPSACAESSSRERFQHRRWSAYAARCGGRGRPSDRPDTRPARQPRSWQWRVSHETVYAAIYAHPRGALKQSLIEALRQSKPARGRRCRTLAKGNTVLRTCGSCLAPRTSPRARSRATGKAPSQGCMRSHRNRARAMPPRWTNHFPHPTKASSSLDAERGSRRPSFATLTCKATRATSSTSFASE